METNLILSRTNIIPGHEDAYVQSWEHEIAVRQKHGFSLQGAFIEIGQGVTIDVPNFKSIPTGAERFLTCLYLCEGDVEEANKSLSADKEAEDIILAARAHEVQDAEVSRVTSRAEKLMATAAPEQMIIMRRYNIRNDWDEFIDVWKKIVPVREQHGFKLLFAVEDKPQRVFSWAFTYEGDSFSEFMKKGQKAYYDDPRRVELETVNNYLDEIRLSPCRQLNPNKA